MTKFPGDENGSGDAERERAALARAMAWADSQLWQLPSTTRIREEGRWVLESARKWAAATKGSAGPEHGLRRLLSAFFNQRLPDLHAALESLCIYADQVRAGDPDVKFGRVLLLWATTAPEALVLQHVLVLYLVVTSKAIEEQELAAAAVARKFAKDLALVQSACRRFRTKWLEVAHDDGAGGAGFVPGVADRLRRYAADVTGYPLEDFGRDMPLGKVGPGPVAAAVARARRTLLGPLVAIDEQAAKAIDGIGASFFSIELGVGKNGRPARVGQKKRVWWLAEAGVRHAAIGRFEGLTEKAVASIVTRVRRELRTQVEQPRPSHGAGQPQASR